jgi:dihydrofolate reductase
MQREEAPMPKLVVRGFALSLDGYGASTEQSRDEPFGKGGSRLMDWFFPTRTFKAMVGEPGGETGIDDRIAAAADEGVGATIMGRHMFGPDRGDWDLGWKGWWGDEPPYHHPVFVLCHRKRDTLDMKGGTSFAFVTEGIESALEMAFAAAKGKDVRVGGGPATVRQYLKAGLVDEMRLAQVPLLLGRGERLFEGLEGLGDRYECVESVPSERATHLLILRKR